MTESKTDLENMIVQAMLEKSHLFKSLDETGRDELRSVGEVQQVPEGRVVIREGSQGDGFYILLKGKVAVETEKDGKPLELAELARGSVIGEVALLTGQPRTATVTAREPSVLLKFSEPGVNTVLDRYPKVKELLARVLVHRAKDTIEKRLLNE